MSYGYPAIVAVSIATTCVVFPVWLIRDELTLFSVFVWIGYLFALQGGFLVGAYVAMDDED